MSSSIAPWYSGQTYPSLDIPLATDAGTEDLTGVNSANITMIFRNTAVSPAVDTTGTGTFSIKSVNPGELLYKFSPADVAVAFNGLLFVKINFPPSGSNLDTVVYDPIPFTISAD